MFRVWSSLNTRMSLHPLRNHQFPPVNVVFYRQQAPKISHVELIKNSIFKNVTKKIYHQMLYNFPYSVNHGVYSFCRNQPAYSTDTKFSVTIIWWKERAAASVSCPITIMRRITSSGLSPGLTYDGSSSLAISKYKKEKKIKTLNWNKGA